MTRSLDRHGALGRALRKEDAMRISRPRSWFWGAMELEYLRTEIATLERASEALRAATAVAAGRARFAAGDVPERDPGLTPASLASITDIQDAASKRRVRGENLAG
jgi:hypothetical protein